MFRQRVNLIAFFVVVLAAVLSFRDQPSSGQQRLPDTTRKVACGCFCGGPTPGYFMFGEKDCAGILAADACGNAFGSLPEADRKRVCTNLKAAGKGYYNSCPMAKTLIERCESPEKPPEDKCEKPTPWFGNSSTCKDVQAWIAEMDGRTVTLSICGAPVFRHVVEPPGDANTYSSNLLARVIKSTGTKICCDKFREAARTGVPCDPRADVDCDGKPNQSDIWQDFLLKPNETDVLATPTLGGPPYPNVKNLFTTVDGTSIDRFPPGLNPDDAEFFPPQDQCDCKWELKKGTLNCSPDGRQRHFYEARWRCPSTGNERYTRKYAAPTAPCTQPAR